MATCSYIVVRQLSLTIYMRGYLILDYFQFVIVFHLLVLFFLCINAAVCTRVSEESEEVGYAHIHAACFSSKLNTEISTGEVELAE